ncbi:MAG: hypothetical protein ACJAS1_006031 [Oleiphilaceae bacterium]|jgi:hypothetical protein
MNPKCRNHSAELKKTVALAAIESEEMLSELVIPN